MSTKTNSLSNKNKLFNKFNNRYNSLYNPSKNLFKKQLSLNINHDSSLFHKNRNNLTTKYSQFPRKMMVTRRKN